jgi:hypothetical protein
MDVNRQDVNKQCVNVATGDKYGMGGILSGVPRKSLNYECRSGHHRQLLRILRDPVEHGVKFCDGKLSLRLGVGGNCLWLPKTPSDLKKRRFRSFVVP